MWTFPHSDLAPFLGIEAARPDALSSSGYAEVAETIEAAWRGIYRRIYGATADSDLAEELTQEVFCRVLSRSLRAGMLPLKRATCCKWQKTWSETNGVAMHAGVITPLLTTGLLGFPVQKKPFSIKPTSRYFEVSCRPSASRSDESCTSASPRNYRLRRRPGLHIAPPR